MREDLTFSSGRKEKKKKGIPCLQIVGQEEESRKFS